MKNKLLVIVDVPYIESEYDVYIPINKKVGTIKELLSKSIIELSNTVIPNFENLKLYSKVTGKSYNNDAFIKDSGIKMGETLILL